MHQACIERWVDEKQKGHIAADVQCPQCGTTLVIKFPKPNFVVAVLDTVDRFIQKLCPVRIIRYLNFQLYHLEFFTGGSYASPYKISGYLD